MRLHTLFTIFSLIAPVALVTAADSTSIPVLIKDCATNRPTKNPYPIGTAMTLANHPCWILQEKAYASTFVNGNFTLYQYNLDSQIAPTLCDINVARTNQTLKSWTNIQPRTCITDVGYSFDWAPTERYIGRFNYMTVPDMDKTIASTCNDTIQLPQHVYFGETIKPDWCEYERTRYVEVNGTVSKCEYEYNNKTDTNSTTYPAQDDCSGAVKGCEASYRYNICTKESTSDTYYYWFTFGAPPTTPTPTTPVPTTKTPTTATPTTKAPINNATASPNATAPPTSTPTPTAKPTLKPSSDASCTSSTSIFTIMVTMAMAMVARM